MLPERLHVAQFKAAGQAEQVELIGFIQNPGLQTVQAPFQWQV
jgi:hypothetical protein